MRKLVANFMTLKAKTCICLFLLVCLIGCKEKDLVMVHNSIGILLIKVQQDTEVAYSRAFINEETYKTVKANWNRAQKSYIEASFLLDKLLANTSNDFQKYNEVITSISIILTDIAIWLEESTK